MYIERYTSSPRSSAFSQKADAISLGAALVTNNTTDFKNIPGLYLVDWVEP